MASHITFYVLSEEGSKLEKLRELIKKIYPTALIFTSGDGIAALKLISKHDGILIILSDEKLQSINGFQLLQKVKASDFPKEVYFIMLSKRGDNNTNLKSLKLGANDYLSEPLQMDEVLSRLRAATLAVKLLNTIVDNGNKLDEMKEKIEQTADKMSGLVNRFQNHLIENAEAITELVKDASVWIAEQYGDLSKEEITAVSRAATICYAGKILLPEHLMKSPVLKDGQLANEKMKIIPINAKELTDEIPGFGEPAKLLYHLYENFDGSGFPENLQGSQIPLGSRILRVTQEYAECVISKSTAQSKAVEMLQHEMNRLYDYRIIAYLDQYFAAHNGKEEGPVDLSDLKAGMTLSRCIITDSGMKIMAASTKLDEDKINKIADINKSDTIIGKIFIKKN